MKKYLLLFAAMLAASASQADVVTDGATYTTTNNINCENLWIIDSYHNSTALASEIYYTNYSGCRTAAIKDSLIYLACRSSSYAYVYRYYVATGELKDYLTVTLDGSGLYGTYVANQIGFDSFGHLYLSDLTLAGTSTQPVYVVDTETGAVSSTISLTKGASIGRIDYIDVIGDLTGTEAPCTIMAAGASTAYVFGWTLAKGGTEWTGYYSGDAYKAMTSFYPTSASQWSTAPSIKILEGSGDTQYTGEYYCVDGTTSYPTIYNASGEVVTSFASATSYVPTSVAVNGYATFTYDDRTFIAYPMGDHSTSSNNHAVNVCEVTSATSFADMAYYWTVPTTGLGATSDGGLRVESIGYSYGTDSDGNQYVNLLVYKTRNGMAVYKISKEVTSGISNTAGSNTVVAEKFYNLSGTQVAEPTDGTRAIYIVVKTYSDGTTRAVKEVR